MEDDLGVMLRTEDYLAGTHDTVDAVLKIVDSWKEFHMGAHKSVLNMISNEVLALKGEQVRYRKKPVEVEAVRFFYGAIHPMDGWVKNAFDSDILFWDVGMNLVVRTLEGDMVVSDGDYIIRGIQGELYPCKPYIFEQTYEPVGDKTERVYRVHSKPDKVFKTQAERDAYIYGYGDGHEDGCSGREHNIKKA